MPLVKRPNQAQIKKSIRRSGHTGVNDVVSYVADAHRDVVRPWKEADDKPVFSTNVETLADKIVGTVKMIGKEAEKAHVTVWTLLNWGTRIRFMGVSEDWQSKTDVRKLSSGPGRGHTTGLDLKDPQPGIVAREWTTDDEGAVAKKVKGKSQVAIFLAWEKGFRNKIGRRT